MTKLEQLTCIIAEEWTSGQPWNEIPDTIKTDARQEALAILASESQWAARERE